VPQTYRFIQTPVIGRFVRRINRFACLVELQGRSRKVYLPNSGRLEDLLAPGARVMLEKRRRTGVTHHDLLLIEAPRFPDREPIWVGLDSRLPILLLRWLLREGLVTPISAPLEISSEPQITGGRLDLKVRTGEQTHWIETKSVNMLDAQGTARFPDAPTRRGAKHLAALTEIQGRGDQSWIVFVVMREDALALSPFKERDPFFHDSLIRAQEAGVQALAYHFAAGSDMAFLGTLPVRLPAPPFPGLWR
jgi:sugar fermentation stimulation protein A